MSGYTKSAIPSYDATPYTLDRSGGQFTDLILYRALVEHAEDAIIAKRLDGTIVAWNAGAERLFGYKADEIIGSSITELVPHDREHEEGTLVARLMQGQSIAHFVTRLLRKDRSELDVSVTFTPIRDGAGAVVGVSTIARDITAVHQQYLAAALSAAILDHSEDAIIAKDIAGEVLRWNRGAERMFGYAATEMIGGPITRLLPQDRLNEEDALIAQLQSGKKLSDFETRRVRKDGVTIEVSVTLSPVRDETGKIVAISKIARDISERRQTRELREKNLQLERSNRDLEDFAYIASHDLKTPLMGIKAAAAWIEEDLKDSLPGDARKILGLMSSRVSRMHTLLDDLLAYSRVGRIDAAVAETNVATMLGSILATLIPPPHIRVRIEGEFPVIMTATAQLEQVLRNLMDNAIKHHDKANGEVVLVCKRVGDRMDFLVRDDGPGIPPRFHEKIFELFQTLKRRDEIEGTGIGLAIVKKLVERQGGQITVRSRGDGTGTEFHFQWPIVQPITDATEKCDA